VLGQKSLLLALVARHFEEDYFEFKTLHHSKESFLGEGQLQNQTLVPRRRNGAGLLGEERTKYLRILDIMVVNIC
jgi:hypothetical protein